MSSVMPELGSKITLISKADIRYEGRLFTVDPQKCTIALAGVRSFGTEERKSQFPIAPQNQVYDYILFRGSDIKDIRVLNNVPVLPNGPAVRRPVSARGGLRNRWAGRRSPRSTSTLPASGLAQLNKTRPGANATQRWSEPRQTTAVVRSTGRSECPICLGAPAAGRVGQCGHVYCWACALHYAHAHDKQPPPCPVCAAPLHVRDMRPTRSVQWGPPPEHVTMRLVRRLRGSTTVEAAPARGQQHDARPADILPLDQIAHAPYTKFFSINKQQVRDILERERKEIQDQIMAEIDTTEIVFLEQALDMLKTKEEELNAQYDPPKPVMEEAKSPPIVYEKQEINQNKIDWFDGDPQLVETVPDQIEDLAATLAQSNLNPDAVEFVGDLNDNQHEEFPLIECPAEEPAEVTDDNAVTDVDKLNQAKYFYFYQAEDGQQVFLNSMNVRLLSASWGALAAAPPLLKGRVLHRETLSLAEQMRKHMPYTAHLPLYCSFDIVELDLRPPYVTDAALNNFAEELDRRARTRARNEREERRRERAARRAAEPAPPPRPDFSSDLVFPACSPPAEHRALAVHETQALAATASASATSIPASPPGLSFAKMASTSGTWRVRKAAAPAPPPPPPDAGEEEEGAAPRALSLSDAIEAALLAAPASSGKKKKHKQKLLFATGVQRDV